MNQLMVLVATAFALVVAMLSTTAVAASFPCDKAASAVEKTICSDPELGTLDEYLGRYYSGARVALAHADACLVSDQLGWLRTVCNPCKDAACLRRVYLQRLATLDALQPGVTRLRNVALPTEMPLVWIVPPTRDQVAAPRNQRTQPLVARGKLVNEITNGDGFVLRTAGGNKHLLLPVMFLDAPSDSELAALARAPNATYEVRGQSETTKEGYGHFAPGKCTFVYRGTP